MATLARAFLLIAFLGLLLVVPRWTLTHPNRQALEDLRADVERMKAEVAEIEMENSRRVDKILALTNSPHARSSRAVAAYGLARPDEIVIRFDEAPE